MKDGSRVTFDGIAATATAEPREVRLNGVGKSGKRWEAHMCCLDEVYRADLDGNGTEDYIFFGSGPYLNGRMTPLFSLTILLMDSDGLPVPFFTVVYKGEHGGGIKHLVDLDHDGRAELLISTYDEKVSDPRVGPFESGHWTTQLYRFRNFGAEEFRGTAGGLRFPLVHAWTYHVPSYKGFEKPIMTIQPPPLYEHGTSSNGELTTSARCKAIGAQTIVYDHANVREIAFPNPSSSYDLDPRNDDTKRNRLPPCKTARP